MDPHPGWKITSNWGARNYWAQACLHGCTIGDEVLVGIGATVLDGAIIEDQVMIGAGSLVPPGKPLNLGTCTSAHLLK